MSTGTSTTSGTSASSSSGPGGHSSNSGVNKGVGENLGGNRGRNRSESTNSGYSETMDNIVEPNFFTYGLKTGGPAYGGQVSAVLFKNSGNFKANHGQSFMTVTFQQQGGQ